jgi:hypothetical protein
MAQYVGKYEALKQAGEINPYPSGKYNAKVNIIIEESEDAMVAADELQAAAIPDGAVLLDAKVLGQPGVTVTLLDSDAATALNIGDEVLGNSGFFFVVDGAVASGSKFILEYSQS